MIFVLFYVFTFCLCVCIIRFIILSCPFRLSINLLSHIIFNHRNKNESQNVGFQLIQFLHSKKQKQIFLNFAMQIFIATLKKIFLVIAHSAVISRSTFSNFGEADENRHQQNRYTPGAIKFRLNVQCSFSAPSEQRPQEHRRR